MDYTKGEWKFEKADLTIRSNDFKNGTQMGDYKGVIVADLKPALGCDYSDNVDLERTGRSHAVPQTLANAHLIAAAPKLYEALSSLFSWCNCRIPNDVVGKVDKALAKAEGGKTTYQITQELRREMREG